MKTQHEIFSAPLPKADVAPVAGKPTAYSASMVRHIQLEAFNVGKLEGQKENGGEVMEMALCEKDTVVLRIGQLYRFVPVAGCKECDKLKQEHDEAYSFQG